MLQEFDEELGREWKSFCRRANKITENVCHYQGEFNGRYKEGDNIFDYHNPKISDRVIPLESLGSMTAEVTDNYDIIFEGDIPVPAKGVHVSADKKSMVSPPSAKAKAFDIAKDITEIDGCAVIDFHEHPDTIHVHFQCVSHPLWHDEMATVASTDKFREQSDGILKVIEHTL